MITENWTWSGFGKSVLTGAVTGAVSGRLNATYTATGFQGAVVMGSINGAIGGGVDALLNGKNFATGFYQGGLMGAAVGAVGYVIRHFVYNKFYQNKGITSKEFKADLKYDPSISNEEMSCNISQTSNQLSNTGDYGAGNHTLGNMAPNGYLEEGKNGAKKILAYTGKRNFWTGKSDIFYSARAAQDKYLLKFIMLHETGHAYSNMLFLPDMKINVSDYDDTTEHLALGFLEHDLANINNLGFRPSSFFTSQYTLEKTLKLLNAQQMKLFNDTYQKLMPIFNRIIK